MSWCACALALAFWAWPLCAQETPVDARESTASETTEQVAGEVESAPASPRGRPAEELRRLLAAADDAWFFGNYLEVISLLDPLLLPEPDAGLTEEQLVSAYELFAASLHFQYGPERSGEAFLRLLRLKPDHDLNPFLYPASMIEFLEEVRLANEGELEAIRESRRDDVSGQLFVSRTVERRSLIVSMIPLGIGHFLNGETGWGTFYLATELALGGLSMGMFAANELARGDDGLYGNAGPAETRQAIQIGSGIAFFVVLVTNVVHGAVIHQDILETTYEILDEPPADFLGPSPPLRTPIWGGPTEDGWELGVAVVF